MLTIRKRALKLSDHPRLIKQELPGGGAGIEEVIPEHRVTVVQVIGLLEGRDLDEDLQGGHLHRLKEALFTGPAFVRDEAHS